MNSYVWKYFLGITGIGAVFFCCCTSGTGPVDAQDNTPALSGISTPDSVYAGYPRLYEPSCTMTVSFNYNPSKVKSIVVRATLDSGKTWIPVASVTPNSTGMATVVWPLAADADTGYFRYFGYKDGYLKISDSSSGASITSGSFSIIGAVPFVLTAPLGGETFSVNDSISLLYGVNTNLTAQIKPCIRPDDSTILWKAIESYSSVTTTIYQRDPIRLLMKKFSLAYYDSTLGWTDKWVDHKLQVMLKDYGPGGIVRLSGLITITTD